jgi:ribosomal protein L16 Arg81 hydroxylase
VLESPLRDQPWTDRRPAVEAAAATEPLIDAVLKPGDCLYLPRGYLHAATALGGVSTHLTIGVHTWTRTTLAEQVVAEAMARLRDDPEVRASLALGADVGDAATLSADLALVRERLAAAVSAVADEAVAARMAARERSAQRAAPVGPLAQLRASSSLPDEVRLREHLSARLVPSPDGGARLVSRAAPVTLEPAQLEPVRALLAAGSARRDDLGDDLARRLLLAGVVTAR